LASAALEKLAEDVLILDLRQLSSVIDFFVVVTSESQRQSKAIAEHIEEALNKKNRRVLSIEGFSRKGSRRKQRKLSFSRRPAHVHSGEAAFHDTRYEEDPSWVLMDCQDVVLHILNPAARDFYKIEKLWGDAPHLVFDSH
jgi:ribosome-associated protein